MLFYETVNARSINKASALLDMPKSTISRRLRMLEQQFNSTLLKRGARSLSLTETGRALYQRCLSIVAELEKANLQTAAIQEEMSGVLRISMPSFFVGWVAEAIADFARQYPALRLEIEALNRHVDVSEEPFDLAIHFGKPAETFHPTRLLAELPRNFYATPGYLKKHGTPTRYSELARHDMIAHQFQMRDKVFPWFTKPDGDATPLPPRAVVNNAVLVRDLILRDLGIGLMPDIMCLEDVADGRLVRVALDWQSPPLAASATYLARRYAPAKTRAFLDHLSAFLRKRAYC
ncbi:LysR family transcriptional regulator [Chelativorans sp.]|uniref:LysR family transcriptional regulator n=1 Tax=Chelativorans sp. TaxID=2203393 RepID=UPI002810B2DC|nr:LysR family transcriptional regulator [Chelativorans sp.]